MSTRRDFDRTTQAWLAEGPSELADRVLDAALHEVHSTHQRRLLWGLPWRTPAMNTPQRVAAGVAIVAVIGFAALSFLGRGPGYGAGPTPSPTLSPSPIATVAPSPGLATMPPLSATFVSPWYGYQVKYPVGWQTTPGQGPWPVGLNLEHLDPHLDEIRGPIGGRMARIVGASVALPAGMGLEGFRAFASPQASVCKSVDPLAEPLRVDGVAATISLNGCTSLSELNGLIWDVVLVTGGRGYDFTLDGFLTAAEAQAWLDGITLEPATAPPPSPRAS